MLLYIWDSFNHDLNSSVKVILVLDISIIQVATPVIGQERFETHSAKNLQITTRKNA